MDGVDVSKGSGLVRELNDVLDRIDGADSVRGVSDGDQFRVLVDLRRQVGHVERAIFVVDLGPTDGHPAVFRHQEPRGDVGVMVEARDEDLISGLEFAADRARDGKGQRRHVGPKATSSAPQCRKSAMAARASAIIASVWRLVA